LFWYHCSQTALHRAVYNGHCEIVANLVAHGADVEAKAHDG
jgi:ankyrin repeat protein